MKFATGEMQQVMYEAAGLHLRAYTSMACAQITDVMQIASYV